MMADQLNAQTAALAASTTTAKLNEQIVTQTLDKVNKAGSTKSSSQSSMSDTYDLSKKVLSAVYEGKGTIADSEG